VARIARAVVPGVAHHITQRGNRREDVFFSDADRTHFLGLLRHYSAECGLEILGYCLMTNHLHLVVVPEYESSLARVLKPLNLRYARYVNVRNGWSGRLWQERFYSCPMDGEHTLKAVRYVEQNPVRARMVERAEDYLWSSAAGHTGRRVDPLLSDRRGLLSSIENWAEWLRADDPRGLLEQLRLSTRTGRPIGSITFTEAIEQRLGRNLRPRQRGRPRRQ
jgi:putative transposase